MLYCTIKANAHYSLGLSFNTVGTYTVGEESYYMDAINTSAYSAVEITERVNRIESDV